jgi:hypothetical protein
MDREMIAMHLEQAEEHVRLGEKHIASQRAVVAELESLVSRHASQARALLATFISMQEQHVADRDRLAAEIAAADANR